MPLLAAFLAIVLLVLAAVPNGRPPLSNGPAPGTAFLQSMPEGPAPAVRSTGIAAIDGEEVAGDPWPGGAAHAGTAPRDGDCLLPRRRVMALAAADRPVPERPPRAIA